ncbi:MAG: polysaccharide biosynthesis C-terminal domain-containing protein, partial [Agathobacter sp.]|nr:polysaccharide biosynthesis C-terminal domain-containing protein [Agathobacter sp.]
KTYVNGSPMLKVLSVAILFALVSSLFTNCILILNRLEQKCLVGTVISATINVVLNMVLIPIMGGIGAAITTVIAEFVNMIIQAFYAKKYLKITFLLQRKCVVKTFIYSIIVIVICLLIKNICVMNNLYTSVIAVFITILSSGILCLLINSIFNKSERNNNDHI